MKMELDQVNWHLFSKYLAFLCVSLIKWNEFPCDKNKNNEYDQKIKEWRKMESPGVYTHMGLYQGSLYIPTYETFCQETAHFKADTFLGVHLSRSEGTCVNA